MLSHSKTENKLFKNLAYDEKSFRFEMDRWNKQNDPPLPETELEKIIIDILGHQSRKREAIGDEVED